LHLLLLFVVECASLGARAESFLIGAEDDWYPFTGLKDGKIQGMSVDIVRAAFAASGTQVELLPYPYARCMQMTLKGLLSACFNTTPNERIRRDYLLPDTPLFSNDIVLWARREQAVPLDDLRALSGRKVAVTIGYEYGSTFDNLQTFQRVPVRKDLNGFLMLQHGRVDYSIAWRGTAEQLFHDTPELQGQFAPVSTVRRAALYLSFSRNQAQASWLLKRFDEGMRIIQANGRYRQIVEQWQPRPATAAN
jgi:polar amino acid transport system substrate-binding protein